MSREVPGKFEATFFARILHRGRRSFCGLVNLDEAGGVSMMSIGAAYQRLLLRLHTSRQWKNLSGLKQGFEKLERFRKVLACPCYTIIFMSENDVQGGTPTHLTDEQ